MKKITFGDVTNVLGNVLGATIPHLHYGNYGGYWAKGNGREPIDKLDQACRTHDIAKDNERLLKELWEVKPSEMKYRIYGQIFRIQCTIGLWPLVKLGI